MIKLIRAEQYRLYEVKDEPDLQDGLHLELHNGKGIWQGYRMPEKISAGELITKVTG